MRDCQTTGGYPRVLQLTEKAITVLSQKTTGNSLKLRLKDV
jgi:antagonist of KipI